MAKEEVKKLYRSRNKQLLGVCAGMAEYMNTDPTVVRIAWVILTLFTGFVPGLLVYVLLGLLIPEEPK